MPRIPESEIERIKRETDLAALVRSRGVELRTHGSKDLIGKCPFHQEEEPSFVVTPDKGLFHCMGCGVAGNCIQFVEKFDGVSFRHAVELLNDGKAVFTSPSPTGDRIKKASVPRLELPFDPEATDAELMRQIVDYYHERLLKAPAAQAYLRGRGLWHEEAVRHFRLGVSDRSLGLRLPGIQWKAGAAIRTRLQKLGIYRENGREHMNGRVVLPIPGLDGRTKLYGRLFAKPNPGAPKHLYLPGPHEGIWNPEAFDSPELILCEAAFDALTFWIHGFKNVTFIYGTEGMTDEIFDAIITKKVRRLRIAYDADDAGNRAAARDTERFLAHGIEVYRVKFPWGMDANEYANKVTPAAKSLQTVLNAAEWLGGHGAERIGHGAGCTPVVTAFDVANICQQTPIPSRSLPESHICELAPTHAPAGALSSELVATNLLAADEKKATNPHPSVQSVVSPLHRSGDYHVLTLGPREYRVGGLDKNNSLEVLKVAVRLRVGGDPSTPLGECLFHLDSFDMARDGERRRFIERAAEETRLEKDLVKRDLGKLLLALEQEQSDRINSVLNPESRTLKPEMTSAEREEALELLKAPDLIDRITGAFPICGLAGEGLNSISAYLACTSRKLDKPLAIIIQSTTAAGKSTVMDAVLSMFPEEERVKYSAMTGQSLYYLGEANLKHKILAIVEEEGAEKASYALKLLQSEGELTIASTGKDPQTGRMETQEYHVEGPVMIFLTTTAVEIDEELLNRCLILTVDESKEQTERIHTLQRKARTLEGLVAREEKKDLLRVLRNAQRLLQPLAVVNPFADELTFTAERTRTRRDHEKYLTLIDAVALLHQHQRTVETREVSGRHVPFIRATLDDIAMANRLALELLGRTLDELPPQTRRLLETIKHLVKAIGKEQTVEQSLALFSRRDLQRKSGWSYSQIKRHLFRLQELEYIAPRFGRMGATLKYELLIDADEPTETAHIGLLDVEKLRVASKLPSEDGRVRQPTWTGENATFTPPCQNEMARLSLEMTETCVNLATLPDRTSGAALAVGVS
jgi:DNA primase catalytic core